MPRVKRGVTTKARHKKILAATKGYRGLRNRTFKQAKTAWMKAGVNAYRDRKVKRRLLRALWITRLSSSVRALGMPYSRFIAGLTRKAVLLDRKVMSEIARVEPEVFAKIVDLAKEGMTLESPKWSKTPKAPKETAKV